MVGLFGERVARRRQLMVGIGWRSASTLAGAHAPQASHPTGRWDSDQNGTLPSPELILYRDLLASWVGRMPPRRSGGLRLLVAAFLLHGYQDCWDLAETSGLSFGGWHRRARWVLWGLFFPSSSYAETSRPTKGRPQPSGRLC